MDITSTLPTSLAFGVSFPLRHTTLFRPLSSATSARRRPRSRQVRTCRPRMQTLPDDEPDNTEDQPDPNDMKNDQAGEGDIPYENLFVDEGERSFWEDLNVRTALRPITEEEKTALRAKLPPRVANFLIRRADEAVRLREPQNEQSFFGKLLKELPPDLPEEDDDEYSDYVFETMAGPPTFRRRGSALFGGGDGLPDTEDNSMDADVIDSEGKPKNLMSLFVGRVGSIDEQASNAGYGLLALFAGLIIVKILFAFISFFVSFTFSFFAIFALSAGIFMVFFIFKW